MKRFIVRKVLSTIQKYHGLINTPLPLHHHPLIYHKKILDVIGICVTQENIEYVISKIQSIFYCISSFFYNPHGDELCNPTILQPSGSLYRFEQRPQEHLIFSAPYDIYIIYIYVCLENRSHNMPQASVQRSNRNNHCSNCLVPSGADENMATSMLTSSVFSQI